MLFLHGSPGTSLAVQWLRLRASNLRGPGLIPVQRTKISYALWHSQMKYLENKKQLKKYMAVHSKHLYQNTLAYFTIY